VSAHDRPSIGEHDREVQHRAPHQAVDRVADHGRPEPAGDDVDDLARQREGVTPADLQHRHREQRAGRRIAVPPQDDERGHDELHADEHQRREVIADDAAQGVRVERDLDVDGRAVAHHVVGEPVADVRRLRAGCQAQHAVARTQRAPVAVDLLDHDPGGPPRWRRREHGGAVGRTPDAREYHPTQREGAGQDDQRDAEPALPVRHLPSS
jgi:hypothetical protein